MAKTKIYCSLFISILFLSACKKTDVLKINSEDLNTKESCLYFYSNGTRILNVDRQYKILENTLTDTLSMAFGIVAPGQIGEFVDLKMGDELLYEDSELPGTDSLCLHRYKNKIVRGKLKIEFTY